MILNTLVYNWKGTSCIDHLHISSPSESFPITSKHVVEHSVPVSQPTRSGKPIRWLIEEFLVIEWIYSCSPFS